MKTDVNSSYNQADGRESAPSGTGSQFASFTNPVPFDANRWMTRKQAAQYLNMSMSGLDNWAKSGRLIPHKDGRFVRYDKLAIDERMEQLQRYKPARYSRRNQISNNLNSGK